MGREVCQAVSVEEDLELVAAVDPSFGGIQVGELSGVDSDTGNGELDLAVQPDVEGLLQARAEVVVDFTRLEAARANLEFYAANRLHAVVGTSGFTEADHKQIASLFTRSNCLIAPNFAIGAVLMIRFAELAAPYFDTAEVIEFHHDGKVDAPSGTAVNTAERMAAANATWAEDPTVTETLPGARGAKGAAGIPVHSVRMRGMTAHQEVVLGTAGQTLTVRHDSYDRSSFMPGVIMAIRRIDQAPGLTVGLDGLFDW
jgi:4-hydroxy-tetrahydrodipicolinate reductase